MQFTIVQIILGVLLINYGYCDTEQRNVCRGKVCNNRVIAPLLDNHNAPMVATLDLTTANEKINHFIHDEIEEKMSNLTETKLKEVLAFLNLDEKMKDYLDKTMEQNLDKVISRKVDKMLQDGERHVSSKVAFFATLSGSHILEKNEVVRFDTVKTNIGQGYSRSTGVFTVPLPGIYQFSVNFIKGISSVWFELQLIKNDEMIARGLSGLDKHISGSIQVILDLKKGDEMFVRHPRNNNAEINGGDFCMFSGHRI